MRLRLVLALLAAVTPVVALATPASAAGGVNISRVWFDSPGSDTGSSSSLNAEYITLKNYGTTSKTITGWTIVDAANHRYTFGTFALAGGASVTVHTGRGTNSSSHRYWGSGSYIWNNTGDKASLYSAPSGGTLKDSCTFTGAGDYTSC